MSDSPNARPDVTKRLQAWSAKPRVRRTGVWLMGLFVVFGLSVYLAGPPLLKSLLLKQLTAELQREVSIERIDVNPYALSVQVQGLSVREPGGREVFGFDRLVVNASTASIVLFGAVADEIRLENPRLSVLRIGPDKLDISDLIEKWSAPSEPSPPPRFSLNNILVSGGQLRFEDQVVGSKTEISELALQVPFISSLAYRADAYVEPLLAARIGDAAFKLTGKALPFAADRHSEINLDLDALALAPISPYLRTVFPVVLQSGLLDTRLKLAFSQPDGQKPALKISGDVGIRNFQLDDAQGGALARWEKLAVMLKDVDPVQGRYDIDAVALEKPDVAVNVDGQGKINWLLALKSVGGNGKSAAAKPKSEAGSAEGLNWSLAQVSVKDGVLRWQDRSGGHQVKGELQGISLQAGPMDSSKPGMVSVTNFAFGAEIGDRLKLAKLSLNDVQVDAAAGQLRVAKAVVGPATLKVVRDAKGKVEFVPPPVLAGSGEAAAKSEAGAGWQFAVDALEVGKIGIEFADASTDPVAVQKIADLSLTASNLGNAPKQQGKLKLSAAINGKGALKIEGALGLAPLGGQFELALDQLALLPLQPYFSEFLNVAVTRGQFSGKGQVTLATPADELQLAYRGMAGVQDFLAVDKINNADFLRWRSLQLSGLDVELAPMKLGVKEIALSGFYSRLILSPKGELNLAQIVRRNGETVSLTSTEAVAGAASPSSSQDTAKPAEAKVMAGPVTPVMPVRIDQVVLKDGRINFSDLFVKPNYSADLHKVNGQISGLSSSAEAPATLKLEAAYDQTAPVRIDAKLQPFAQSPFLDLQGAVKSVNMTSFSPYAGKYAGYNIQKGKLSLDVAYKLENGQLKADNRVFIDQLTFGEKVESPDATTLPVNLAIALLKNSRGEIDINLPISGSLDDPSFSVGGLVVRVIVNLFVKAVTSPFALLGSLFGGGEELSHVNFAPGYARIEEAGEQKLQTLAKAMIDRSGLKLEITGRADPAVDVDGLKRAAVDRAVRAQKQKAMVRKGEESGSLREIRVSPEEYPKYLKQAYGDADFKKPRNLVGMQKDLPVEEMERLMLENQVIKTEDVQALAERRAQRVQTWLIESGKVPAERLFVLPPKVAALEAGTAPGVDFSLR